MCPGDAYMPWLLWERGIVLVLIQDAKELSDKGKHQEGLNLLAKARILAGVIEVAHKVYEQWEKGDSNAADQRRDGKIRQET